MDLEVENTDVKPDARLRKYRLAGYGFIGLNIVYIVLALIFIPPFNITLTTIVSIVLSLALVVLFTVYILRGKKRLVQILAVIYGARSLFSIYTLASGGTFPAIPYFLPCLLITFYLLGRAGWDWP